MRVSDTPLDQLPAAGHKAHSGFLLHHEALKLPNSLGENLATAVTECEARDAAYYASAVQLTRIGATLAEADAEGIAVIQNAKNFMRLKLGLHWTPVYAQAGFTQSTLQTPTSMEGRQALLADLAKFFSQQPGWSSKDPEISAGILHGAANQLKAALDQEGAHERSHRTLVAAREEAGARVRTRLRSLMNEASIGLSDDDERWADFGCESPATIRAAKPVRELKSQTKAEKAQERRFEVAIGRAEIAKGKGEKLRVRAEKAQRDAERLRAEADEAIAFAEGLFAKAHQLKPGSSAPGTPSDPNTAARSNEPVAVGATGVGATGVGLEG
jgi:hypothetical protein